MGVADWFRKWNWLRELEKLNPAPAEKDAPSITLTPEERAEFDRITENLK